MQYDTPQPRLSGGIFEYIDTHTIQLTVTDSPFARIYVFNATTHWTVASSANLTCDLEVEGAGGLHDDHFPEVVDTCYVVYAAWESDTAVDDGVVKLFAVPSGTTVDAALVAALTDGGAPAGYDTWSLPIGMMVNDGSGDIYPFWCIIPGEFVPHSDLGIQAIANATTAALTAVDCSAFLPDECVTCRIYTRSVQTAAVSVSCELSIYDGTTNIKIWITPTLNGNLLSYARQIREILDIEIVNTADITIYYEWSAAPTGGLDLHIQSIKLY